MKILERLINRLNFGIFFPYWVLVQIENRLIDITVFGLSKYVRTPQQIERAKKNLEDSRWFVNDLQLYNVYGLLDFFCGFSIAIMFMVVTFDNIIERKLCALLFELNIDEPAKAVLFAMGGIISYLPMYYFHHRNDKREKYFDEFDKEPSKRKWIWSAISYTLYLSAWGVAFGIRHILDVLF